MADLHGAVLVLLRHKRALLDCCLLKHLALCFGVNRKNNGFNFLGNFFLADLVAFAEQMLRAFVEVAQSALHLH